VLRTLDVMPSSDRPDAIASADADPRHADHALPEVANGDVEPERSESADSSPPADATRSPAPAVSDDSEATAGTHELLAPRDDVDDDRRSHPKPKPESKPEPVTAQLVSGDPLLRAASASTTPGPKAPAPSKAATPPPPPPADKAAGNRTEPPTTAIGHTTGAATIVPGGGPVSSGQPARRAARGAHVAAPRVAVPPTRSPEQPVATLRPTTVAPVPRLAGRRPRVRRVTRVVRHVDPWSVFKVAAVFSIVLYAIGLVAGVLLWNVAYATGTIDNIERGMESTGWEVFELDGGEIFHNAWIGGLFGAVALTGLAVLVATLFNLITDLVGGIRLTVLEEEVVEKTASPMRRFAPAPARRPAAPSAEAPSVPGAEARVRRARGG
jgi:hypothetical protein